MLGGGKDNNWLAPLDEEGNRQSDDIGLESMIGCHTGSYTGLNVVNPQPGYEYKWERNTGPDLLRSRQNGGQVVQSGDPERAAMNEIISDGPSPLDTSDVYNDVVLMRYPEERMREIREREHDTAQKMMRGGANDFMDRVSQAEEMLSSGRSTRFRRSDHRLDYVSPQGDVVEQWAPEDGIIS
tara:strand:+ start:8930 stop:9478 length:549 start_codon:yes stop_codon:yes gene_type:complete